jgi:peptidoglycan/LPS O-acetylase OafA/YrhL
MTRTPRNFGLDLARAIAILLVLGNHLYDYFIKTDIGEIWYLAYFALDLFFALSGFLIGGILIKLFDTGKGYLPFSAVKTFLYRRWLRTLPLYYLMFLVNLLIRKFLFQTPGFPGAGYLFFFQNFRHFPPSFFGESWSLAVEEWFYVTYAAGLGIFLYLIRDRKFRPFYKLLGFTLGYLLIFNLFRLFNAPFDYSEYNIVVFRLDSAAYGVLAAVLYHFYSELFYKYRHRTGFTGILLSCTAILLFLLQPKIGRIYILYYPLIGTGLALLVVYLKLLSKSAGKFFFEKPVRMLSRLAYSLYLANLPVILLLVHYYTFRSSLQSVLGMVAAVAGIFLTALLTYTWIEQPFLRFRDRKFLLGPPKIIQQ